MFLSMNQREVVATGLVLNLGGFSLNSVSQEQVQHPLGLRSIQFSWLSGFGLVQVNPNINYKIATSFDMLCIYIYI